MRYFLRYCQRMLLLTIAGGFRARTEAYLPPCRSVQDMNTKMPAIKKIDFLPFCLQRLLDTLDKDDDRQKKRLGEMTRKITVLRVNEKSLSRRYTAMQEVEAALRKENKKYRNDVVAMETAISERLGYLQRHKVYNFCFLLLVNLALMLYMHVHVSSDQPRLIFKSS